MMRLCTTKLTKVKTISLSDPIIEAFSSTTLSGAGEASVHRRRDPNFSSFPHNLLTNLPHLSSLPGRSSTQIKEGRLKQHALSFSHSSAAALWTDSCSELSHVEKDATPWIFATYLSHGHSLLPTIFHSSEMTPALQIISPFLDSRRSTSAFWHLDMKLGFSPVDLVSFAGPFLPFRPKPICCFRTCKAFILRSDFFNSMLGPLIFLCRSPLINGHGHHLIEISPWRFWLFIYHLRILVLTISRNVWPHSKVLKTFSLIFLNCTCLCVKCGFELWVFIAQWSPSSSSIAFKLITMSIIMFHCLIVYAAIDRRFVCLLCWILKLTLTDYRTIVLRILAILFPWVLQLAPVRSIASMSLSTSLRPLTVTNLLSFDYFEDDPSIYCDLTCCTVLLCLCLKALMEFKSMHFIFLFMVLGNTVCCNALIFEFLNSISCNCSLFH
ncbi:hypothetical protein AtEden1_Chr4g0307431 [Arabidopsis thaliana]